MPRLVHVIVWAVAFVITLEVCARLDDVITHGAPFIGSYDNETLYTYDDLGKTGKPHARYLKWELNAKGFRGPELRAGRFRILCIGSSETFGLYERRDGEWPRQLERILNERVAEPPVEVINAAYPGLTLATTLKRLPGWLTGLQPKLVIVYPSLANYIDLPANGAQPESPPRRSMFEPRIVSRVEAMLKSAIPESVQDRIRSFQIDRAAENTAVMATIPEANVSRFREELNALISVVESGGARVVLVTHATYFGGEVRPEDQRMLRAWRKFYPTLAEAGFLDMENRLNDVVRSVAADRGVLIVDAAREVPRGPTSFVEFVHFTDEGAKRLAEILADRLRQTADLRGQSQ
jgi:lysophospholipase L1-like esterase